MHCSSSSGGGGGGGPAFTCANGAPIEGSPDGSADVEQCASCNEGYGLVDGICKVTFSFHSNGVTILCPGNRLGESGTVGGIEYTKRAAGQITVDNAATSCTSGITDMSNLFLSESGFNQDIGGWDVSNVTLMTNMFLNADAFNQDIGSWDVSHVIDMSNMFRETDDFNQDIGGWDVSSVTDMNTMFFQAGAFNQDLSGWCVSGIGSEPPTFSTSSALIDANKPKWGDDTVASCP